MADDIAKQTKDAVKSVFTLKFFVALVVGLFIFFLLLDVTKLGPWFLTPWTKAQAWNEARKAKAGSK